MCIATRKKKMTPKYVRHCNNLDAWEWKAAVKQDSHHNTWMREKLRNGRCFVCAHRWDSVCDNLLPEMEPEGIFLATFFTSLQVSSFVRVCPPQQIREDRFSCSWWVTICANRILVLQSGEIFGHNRSESWCFQVRLVACCGLSVYLVLIWGMFYRFL